MAVKAFWSSVIIAALLTLASCTSNETKFEAFQDELRAGNLTTAEQILTTIDKKKLKEQAALELIRTYLHVDQVDKAINVYENITPHHRGRQELTNYYTKSNSYDRVVCQLLRSYLVSHEDYDRAWRYYPLSSSVEDNYTNAEHRFQYLVDVVNDMCLKGHYDAARKFADVQSAWFAVHVDNVAKSDDPAAMYNSNYVRQYLYEQINRLSY